MLIPVKKRKPKPTPPKEPDKRSAEDRALDLVNKALRMSSVPVLGCCRKKVIAAGLGIDVDTVAAMSPGERISEVRKAAEDGHPIYGHTCCAFRVVDFGLDLPELTGQA